MGPLYIALIAGGSVLGYAFGMGVTHRLWRWGFGSDDPFDGTMRAMAILTAWPMLLAGIAGMALVDVVSRPRSLPPARTHKELP